MSEIKDFMDDKFYKEIVGNCGNCRNSVPRGESHECGKCNKVYCMYCVFYDVNGESAKISCLKGHFICYGVNYESEKDLEKLK